MCKHSFLWVLLCCLVLAPFHVMAGAFRVIPTKITLDSKAHTARLKVMNTGSDQINIQVEGMVWTQDAEGRDAYNATKELVFFPKIFSIAGNEERIVRLGYQGAWPKQEKTYRVFLRELPVSKPGEVALRMILRLGVPVFVRPVQVTPGNHMVIEQVTLAKGQLLVRVKNRGNAHLLVRRIQASGLDKSGTEVFTQESVGWYVLKGVSKPFSMTIPAETCRKASRIRITVEDETSSEGTVLEMDGSACEPPPQTTTAPVKTERR